MKTTHRFFFISADRLDTIADNTIDLVVTSPPYPMIKMWDEMFIQQDSAIGKALENHEGNLAFDLMHRLLEPVWNELFRVTRPGGFVCINTGDATRTLGSDFAVYSNHSRIMQYLVSTGFTALPEIIWRKQTNAPNKFMGSGMLPAGAYVTLEHEFILIFRNSYSSEGNNTIIDTAQG
jgi:DNA modification methylase